MTAKSTKPTKNAAEQIREESGTNVSLCYQCKKCTLGCPLSAEMDIKPNQVIRLLQLGRTDEALRSKTTWLCASCKTCATRCPAGVDIAQVMDALKVVAQERRIESRLPSSPNFINAGLRSIKSAGRMYELGLMLEMNLKGGKPFRDADMGLKMIRSGKLRVIPEWSRFPGKLKRREKPASEVNTLAYYPGCSLHASASAYDKSYKAVAAALGLRLVEPKGWVCCGASAAHWKSHELATELALKNLALIESEGHKAVTVPCAMCFSRLKYAAHDVKENPVLKGLVTRKTGYEYAGEVAIENAVDTMVERVGLDVIARSVKKPASGLKVVCYYGCLLTRPPQVTGVEHPDFPVNMDRLVESLGVKTLDWSHKTECCGGSMSIIDIDTCLNMVKRIMDNARAAGADAIISACPMCHSNLDSRQPALSRREGQQYAVPVLYFTQLMALALGLGEKNADLGGHLVDVRPLLIEKGLLP